MLHLRVPKRCAISLFLSDGLRTRQRVWIFFFLFLSLPKCFCAIFVNNNIAMIFFIFLLFCSLAFPCVPQPVLLFDAVLYPLLFFYLLYLMFVVYVRCKSFFTFYLHISRILNTHYYGSLFIHIVVNAVLFLGSYLFYLNFMFSVYRCKKNCSLNNRQKWICTIDAA